MTPVPPRAGDQGAFPCPGTDSPHGIRPGVCEGQRLNRWAHGERNPPRLCTAAVPPVQSCCRCGLPGQRTHGRAAQSFPLYLPRQRISEEVPQDIPGCRSAPPKTLPDNDNRQLRPSNPFDGYVHITVI
ncbi:hypothetical protein GCM10009564_41470 [Streptomyces thermogriseus]|uniref:Uncharacterized protein n=1 Tax=Streptomyces thermogriseus TaxID=75292 RepID=A0ABN1T3D8_9ACTN